MERRIRSLCGTTLLMLGLTAVWGETKEFRAATGRVEITPPPGLDLWGYSNRKSGATGTLDPLYARILVLSDAQRTVGLVTLDLGRTFGVPSLKSVRDKVRRSAGIDQVFFCASHTHSGPVIEDSYPEGQTPQWEQSALEKISGALEDAKKRLAPARIGTGFGQTHIGHNRRWVNPDGSVKMFWRNATRIPTSPVDPTVGVIRLDGADGSPIAILVNYACHPVVFGPDNLRYSADYPGAMAKYVEESFANKPICIFLQGAPGDINPYMDKTPLTENAEKIMVEVGQQLGQEAARVASTIQSSAPANPSLKASLDTLVLGIRWDLKKLLASMAQTYGEAAATRYQRILNETIEAPIMTLVLNDEIALAGIPGEPFVDFQIDLRARSPLRSTFLVGYANGYFAYFPTMRAAVEGGYGANSLTTRVEVGAGEAIVNHALVTIYKMLGKLKDLPMQ